MMNVRLTNEILSYISQIEVNRYKVTSAVTQPGIISRLRKVSKRKSSYASNKIEGNPLTESQANEAIESDNHRHLIKPEQEIRNYFLALNFLEDQAKQKKQISKQLILDVQELVEKKAPEEKIGLRDAMPPGVLFAVYDTKTGQPEYIPPEASEISDLLDELVQYINTTDDHLLIVAAVTHYQLVTIHPFEDGNGRTARLLSGYILDINGYGFNGIGSLEEYFAYDVDEYYASLQMGLPSLYYSGRDNPPQPEIWINYFLRMVSLYSEKVCDLQMSASIDGVKESLSHLSPKEKELLLLLINGFAGEFTPVELSGKLSVTNRTVINRLSNLVKCGFVEPLLVNERVMSYRLSQLAVCCRQELLKLLECGQ